MSTPARGCVVAIAAVVALGLAGQSCGVFSSGACTDKAICADVDGSSDDATSADVVDIDADGANPEGGDDAADVANDDRTGPDVGDVVSADVGDVVSADAGDVVSAEAGDVVSENAGDVVSEDAPFLAPDACVGTGCADAGCPASYACAPPVPGGWSGPALLWTGAFGSSPPPCPTGYPSALDANAGPTGSADTCSCTCTASGQSCSLAVSLYGDAACFASCTSATVSSACTVPPANTCGATISMNAAAPAPSGGGCTAQVMTTPGSTAGWQTAARVCSSGPASSCSAAQGCVPAAPAPYGTSLCIHQSGTAACPTAYPRSNVFYSGESDGRGCGNCSCGGPTGGSCSGIISVYGVSINCTAAPTPTYTLGSNCRVLNLNSSPSHLQGNFTLTAGTCTVQTAASPTGAVTATGPITVCCM